MKTNRTESHDQVHLGTTFGTVQPSIISSAEGPQLADNVTESENFITLKRDTKIEMHTRDQSFAAEEMYGKPIRESVPESSNKDSFARPIFNYEQPQMQQTELP